MNFKLILFISISAFTCFSSKAKEKITLRQNNSIVNAIHANEDDLKAKFEIDVKKYLEAFNQKNWDLVIKMINPKLYDFITKDQMIESFDQLEEMGMNMHIELKEIAKISKVVTVADSKFCRVYYRGNVTIEISGLMLENKDELEKSFKVSYGSENVKYDSKGKRFIINAEKSMIASSNVGTNEWNYIEYNENQMELLEYMFPAEVMTQILK